MDQRWVCQSIGQSTFTSLDDDMGLRDRRNGKEKKGKRGKRGQSKTAKYSGRDEQDDSSGGMKLPLL
jgi:hypothetical protein